MKCPLIRVANWETGHAPQFAQSDCLQAECAWWEKSIKQCDPTGMLFEIHALNQHLANIASLMPRGGTR